MVPIPIHFVCSIPGKSPKECEGRMALKWESTDFSQSTDKVTMTTTNDWLYRRSGRNGNATEKKIRTRKYYAYCNIKTFLGNRFRQVAQPTGPDHLTLLNRAKDLHLQSQNFPQENLSNTEMHMLLQLPNRCILPLKLDSHTIIA